MSCRDQPVPVLLHKRGRNGSPSGLLMMPDARPEARAPRQPRRARGRAEPREAGRHQGNFSEEAFGVEHDGDGGEGGPRIALGTAMTLTLLVAVRDRRSACSGLNEFRPTQTAFLRIQGRRHLNAGKEVDLGS